MCHFSQFFFCVFPHCRPFRKGATLGLGIHIDKQEMFFTYDGFFMTKKSIETWEAFSLFFNFSKPMSKSKSGRL